VGRIASGELRALGDIVAAATHAEHVRSRRDAHTVRIALKGIFVLPCVRAHII